MMSGFETLAVVLHQPQALTLDRLAISEPGAGDVVVEVAHSGISTGTERLLWSGRMPTFPGMGYPLVPGYESVGRVVEAGPDAGLHAGDMVFVPGSNCFGPVRGLFGGAARHVVLPGARAVAIEPALHENGVLLALAATALHALRVAAVPVDLIVGHGALGRLLARLAVLEGATPTVWETEPRRREGARGYEVVDPARDTRRDRRCVIDVSGDAAVLDTLIARLAPKGRIVLAGVRTQADAERSTAVLVRVLPGGSIDLMPIVETALGIESARDIAAAATRVRRLAFGGGDYTLDLQLQWTVEEQELAHARARLVHASRVAGLEPPIDTVLIQFRDGERFRAAAARARQLGFQGKLCIHPDQVPLANAAFSPTPHEVEQARAFVAAYARAEAQGIASIQVDGVFVDAPIVARARRVLAMAGEAG